MVLMSKISLSPASNGLNQMLVIATMALMSVYTLKIQFVNYADHSIVSLANASLLLAPGVFVCD